MPDRGGRVRLDSNAMMLYEISLIEIKLSRLTTHADEIGARKFKSVGRVSLQQSGDGRTKRQAGHFL
jgi:hypothetical protein